MVVDALTDLLVQSMDSNSPDSEIYGKNHALISAKLMFSKGSGSSFNLGTKIVLDLCCVYSR